jgi:hypothetical protein
MLLINPQVQICMHRKREAGNEMVFPDGCIFSARLRSDFCSDQVDTSNAAVQCRWGRMEMQQVGVDFNELRAQARRALYLNELTSSVRS